MPRGQLDVGKIASDELIDMGESKAQEYEQAVYGSVDGS